MATLLADSPAPTSAGQPGPAAPAQAAARRCRCGAPMIAGQDWCLYCGTGAPGSLFSGPHDWRPVAAVLSAVALLVAGAAVAAYAALSKPSAHPRSALSAAARTPVLTAAGVARTPPAISTVTPPPTVPKIGGVAKPLLPLVKAPKVPLVSPAKTPAVATPAPAATTKPVATTTTPAATHTTSTPTATKTTPAEALSEAIVIDTNAATTYNPDALPASSFGDPTLAIDGETSTAWTALVEPARAPSMDAGLLVDLKSPQRVAALQLITSTPGMSVQVFGSAAAAAPTPITAAAWVRLSKVVVAKHTARIKLSKPKQGFRFLVLWVSKAPASAVGSAQAPGHVSVNELELFPPR